MRQSKPALSSESVKHRAMQTHFVFVLSEPAVSVTLVVCSVWLLCLLAGGSRDETINPCVIIRVGEALRDVDPNVFVLFEPIGLGGRLLCL